MDWGLQACATNKTTIQKSDPEAEIFLNTVGTFGTSPIGYWWRRLGAMISRGIRYILGYSFQGWILLFADDGKATFEASICKLAFLILLAFMEA